MTLKSCKAAPVLTMQPSAWWDHPPTHILCCWAWSPSELSFAEEQKRLNTLLQAGMWIDGCINECIFDGGNVLHALLTFDPLHGKPFFAESYTLDLELRKIRHLSKTKFDTLMDTSIDTSAVSELGTALDVAKQTLLQVRQLSVDDKGRVAFKENIEDLLETHIIPTLETRSHPPSTPKCSKKRKHRD